MHPRVPAILLCGLLLYAQSGRGQTTSLKSFYETGLKKNGIVGSRLVLLRGTDETFQDSYGFARLATRQPVDENTAFHWASITKTFTAIAIMQLRDHGRLKLDDAVVKYIPELGAVHDRFGPVGAITIRQLLTHSAGFRNPTGHGAGTSPGIPLSPRNGRRLSPCCPIPR